MTKTTYTDEQRQAWKEEKQAEQRALLDEALANISGSEQWNNWVKSGRNNLRKYSLNNALLIWCQKRDATRVAGRKQWAKDKITVNPDAQAIAILAPVMGKVKDEYGNIVFDNNGKPKMRPVFFRTVYVYDVTETDADISDDVKPLRNIEGDDLAEYIPALEGFARELGIVVQYKDLQDAHGYYDAKDSEIVVDPNRSGNALVRTLVHELCHAYGNVNYTDFSRQEAEVLVESATVMTLGILGFDIRNASVPYILEWGGDLKVLDKFSKLLDELVNTLTKKMGV